MKTIIALSLTMVAATTLAEEHVSCAFCDKQVTVAREMWKCLLETARLRFAEDVSEVVVLVQTKDDCAELEGTQDTQPGSTYSVAEFTVQSAPDIEIPYSPNTYIEPNFEPGSPGTQEEGNIAFKLLLARTQLKCLVEQSELNTVQGDMIVFKFSDCSTEEER